MGVFRGNPPVEKLDVGQTAALAVTGVVFGTYALFVHPRAWLLFSCNAAMAGVHSWNLYRVYRYSRVYYCRYNRHCRYKKSQAKTS